MYLLLVCHILSNAYAPEHVISHDFSIAIYCTLFFYFQFAVKILTNIGFVFTISDLACHCFNTVSPVGIYVNMASINTYLLASLI